MIRLHEIKECESSWAMFHMGYCLFLHFLWGGASCYTLSEDIANVSRLFLWILWISGFSIALLCEWSILFFILSINESFL